MNQRHSSKIPMPVAGRFYCLAGMGSDVTAIFSDLDSFSTESKLS